jgi:hypothetical protein
MFQTLFDDDSLTAADGPYLRLMRMRKWLFLTATLLVSVKYGWLSMPDLAKFLQFIQIPRGVALGGLQVSAIYLLVIFGASSWQYLLERSSIVARRFESQIDLAVKAVQGAYASAVARIEQMKQEIGPEKAATIRRSFSDRSISMAHARAVGKFLSFVRISRVEAAIAMAVFGSEEPLLGEAAAMNEQEIEYFTLDVLETAKSWLEERAFGRTRVAIVVENFIDGARMIPAAAAVILALLVAIR